MEKLKAKDAVLDMEAVIVDEKGKSSFQALQAALGDGGKPENIVAYVFDLLHLDGKDLTRLPLTERKEKLENLLKKSKQDRWLRYSAHIAGEGDEMFAKACEAGLEGIISKTRKRALRGGTPEKLAENQMLAAPGIHHPRLQRRAHGRPGARCALSRLSRRTARCVMPARSAPAFR